MENMKMLSNMVIFRLACKSVFFLSASNNIKREGVGQLG